MLIKDQLLKIVLSKLKIDEEYVSTFLLEWDRNVDDFTGTLFLNNTNKIYDFCIEYSVDKSFELVWIKEKYYKVESKIVYSIDGAK